MMKNSNKIRPINLTEKEIIQNSLNKLDPNLFNILTDEYLIYINFNPIWKSKEFPSIFLISQQQHTFMKDFETQDDIFSVGLYMGFIKRGVFLVSLELVEFVWKKGVLSNKKCIHLNSKGEKSILYGNNILKRMISKTSNNFQAGEVLLIFNELNEILAIAFSKVDSISLENCSNKDIIAINLSDKGYYLRAKQ
jgi:ribosome biogenesis protein Nip4